MNESMDVPEELRAVLKEYESLQEQERHIRERKGELQQRLAAHMESLRASVWMPSVEGHLLKVRYRKSTRVDYNESVLSERLGDRYRSLLRPDIKKIRAHLDAVEPQLQAVLDLVGSPDPEKVKDAVASGVVSMDEFKGAFKKTETVHVSVSKQTAR